MNNTNALLIQAYNELSALTVWVYAEYSFLINAAILIAFLFGLIVFVTHGMMYFDRLGRSNINNRRKPVFKSAITNHPSLQSNSNQNLIFNFNNGRKFAIKLESTLILSFRMNGVEQLDGRVMHLSSLRPGQFQITQINGNFKASLMATSVDGVNFYVIQCEIPTDTSAAYTAV